jgi:hypothetical protein
LLKENLNEFPMKHNDYKYQNINFTPQNPINDLTYETLGVMEFSDD